MAPQRMDRVSGADGASSRQSNRRGSVHVTATRGSGGRFAGSTTSDTANTGASDARNGDTATDREPASDGGRAEPTAGATILESSAPTDNPIREVKRRRGRPRKTDAAPEPVLEFPTEQTAAALAEDAINTMQMIALQFAGPAGQMSTVEYSLSTRGLTGLLAKTPVAQVSRWAGAVAPAVLAAGLFLWGFRMVVTAKAVKQMQRMPQQVTDTEQPANAAPPDSTVSRSSTGDVNGLAVPIPDAILNAARIAGDI